VLRPTFTLGDDTRDAWLRVSVGSNIFAICNEPHSAAYRTDAAGAARLPTVAVAISADWNLSGGRQPLQRCLYRRQIVRIGNYPSAASTARALSTWSRIIAALPITPDCPTYVDGRIASSLVTNAVALP
jgi:hypothetical protein